MGKCKEIGKILDISGNDVKKYFYKFICDNGLEDKIITYGDVTELTQSSIWQDYQKQKEESGQGELEQNAKNMSLALWFIRTVGSIEKAEFAFDLAVSSLRGPKRGKVD